ncbi:hypothetical protein [Nocardiopsis sp. ATB16-24]|uniref:hypothetical protein n=1 Tax=Nocardiopsis sp. ATB16-24 TaxID=3019555 RepID=UPI002554E2CF|nr:hypothetical protein [Nocardiopsis sp. ATB16-24]
MSRYIHDPRADQEDTDEDHTERSGKAFFTDAAGPELRARIIGDMRALADFLQAHPELPISRYTSVDVTYFPLTDDEAVAVGEVAEAGARLGRMPAWEGGHYLVEHAVGAGRYRVVAVPERVAASYRAWLAATGHRRPD